MKGGGGGGGWSLKFLGMGGVTNLEGGGTFVGGGGQYPIRSHRPALFVPSPVLIFPVRASRFPDKLAPRNHPFLLLLHFLVVLLTHFINKPDSSRKLIIFLISFISSLEVINFVEPDQNIF